MKMHLISKKVFLSKLTVTIELIQLKTNSILIMITITKQIPGRLLPNYKAKSYLATHAFLFEKDTRDDHTCLKHTLTVEILIN